MSTLDFDDGWGSLWESEGNMVEETPALQSVPMATSSENSYSSVTDILGGLSAAARNIGGAARDIGTAVGTVQRDARQIGPTYNAARNAAANGGPSGRISQWVQYSSTTDKLVVGLALATLAFMIYQGVKK